MALLSVSLKLNPSFLANAVSASNWGILSMTVMRFIRRLYDIYTLNTSIKSI